MSKENIYFVISVTFEDNKSTKWPNSSFFVNLHYFLCNLLMWLFHWLLFCFFTAMVDKQLELLVFLFPHWISKAQMNDKWILR